MIKVGDFVKFKTPPDCNCPKYAKVFKEGGVVEKVNEEGITINDCLFYMGRFYVEDEKTVLKSIEWI